MRRKNKISTGGASLSAHKPIRHSAIQPIRHSTRNGFTIIEVSVVFLLILAVTFFVLPKSLDNTRQAKLISKWTQRYSELQYMFSVIKAQQDSSLKEEFKKARDEDGKNEILLNTIKPYLRITSEVKSGYKQAYMNQTFVPEDSRYYFNKFYSTNAGDIIGLKWINEKCKEDEVCAIISMDINGEIPPNTWGYDVFGINVFKDKIEPLGKEANPDYLNIDCSKEGYGIYCSYYYLIGGKFD